MKLIKLALKPQTAAPVLALSFASAATIALVFARIIWTGNIRYGFLVYNLFLAWLPLVFALFANEKYEAGDRKWRFVGLAGAWLLFFPNAPYIFTDLIHLTTRYLAHFWVDLTLILICAFTGLVLGFLSLFIMQSVVTRMFGRLASWLFIAVVAGLSGVGICLGRFLRFNSWDVVFQPAKIYHGLGLLVADGPHPSTLALPILFATFLFLSYLILYALTHLQHGPTLSNSRS